MYFLSNMAIFHLLCLFIGGFLSQLHHRFYWSFKGRKGGGCHFFTLSFLIFSKVAVLKIFLFNPTLGNDPNLTTFPETNRPYHWFSEGFSCTYLSTQNFPHLSKHPKQSPRSTSRLGHMRRKKTLGINLGTRHGSCSAPAASLNASEIPRPTTGWMFLKACKWWDFNSQPQLVLSLPDFVYQQYHCPTTHV